MPLSLAETIVRSVRRRVDYKPAKRQPPIVSEKRKQQLADRSKREAEAIAYALANPNEFVTHIAKRFKVRFPVVSDAVKAAKRKQEIAANKRRFELAKLRKVNRLMALVDGELVDPKRVRRIEAIERFVGVRA